MGGSVIPTLGAAAFALALLTGCAGANPASGSGVGVPNQQGPSVHPPAASDGSRPGGLEQEVHEQINAYRLSQGLGPLALDARLGELAREHSREMAQGRIPFGHSGFEQRAQIIRRSYAHSELGENVGYNWGRADPAAEAVARWLRSAQHRTNIAGDFRLTGIGVAENEKGEYYFTQIFLKP
jgi:uncharacterized protein YkwD